MSFFALCFLGSVACLPDKNNDDLSPATVATVTASSRATDYDDDDNDNGNLF